MRKLSVIADDLTGAMDTGLPFALTGTRTVVTFGPAPVDADGVLVLDTETRELPADEAYATVRQAARKLRSREVYKKIDSTLRGNIGRELDAVMDALSLERALVTPAFIAGGRTVEKGRLMIDSVPLRQTDFVRDPLCPSTDHIPALLEDQSRRRIGHIGSAVTEKGADALRREVQRQTAEILVIDAAAEEHLTTIASTATLLKPRCLMCGSAGLAGALAVGLDLPRAQSTSKPERPIDPAPVLLVVGSLRDTTLRQVETACEAPNTSLVELDPLQLGPPNQRALHSADRYLRDGKDVLLTTVFQTFVPDRREAVAAALAQITAELVDDHPLSGLVLTGGAVAVSVCQALGIQILEIERQLAPGVPIARVLERARRGMRLVTKAGGFGEANTLLKAIQHLRGEK